MDYIYPNLCQMLKERGITTSSLAEILNESEYSVDLKLRGELPWLLSDAVRICCLLNTSDVNFLFCPENNNS